MANPVVQPAQAEPAPLPAYPVAPPDATQTNARGMLPAYPTPQAPPTAGEYLSRLGNSLNIGGSSAPIAHQTSRVNFAPTFSDIAKNSKAALADATFGGPAALAPQPAAYPAPVPLAAHQIEGTPEHAIANPSIYDAAAWKKAFSGMPADTFFKMMSMAHQKTQAEQAGGLALALALKHGENAEPLLRALSGANPMALGMPMQPSTGQ